MRPVNAFLNQADSRCGYRILQGERSPCDALIQKLSDSEHICIGELYARMGFSDTHQPHSICVVHILSSRDPFEIFDAIVYLVCVLMVYLKVSWIRANKRFGYEYMHELVLNHVMFSQANHKVTGPRHLRFANESGPGSLASCDSLYSTYARHLVNEFETNDGFPDFSMIDVNHDMFLPKRNCLWLEPEQVCNHLPARFSLPLGIVA